MSEFKTNIPKADALMGSLRSMGYSFEAAIADVIDNSISAQCTFIKLFFPKTILDTIAVGVLDDGCGMSKDVLFEAMRYGSSDSGQERGDQDLGRFGLGMKSASLSQCKVLTVVSKHDGEYCSYTWDFNIIQQRKDWLVQEHTQTEIKGIPYVNELQNLEHGTLVVWQDFDVLSKSNEGRIYDALNDIKEPLNKYLGLVFHRYLSDKSKNKITISINNCRVEALDPFLSSHPKTTGGKEKTLDIRDSKGVEQLISIIPYVLPYATDLSNKDKKLVGGIEDLRSKQGFYVYRNRRLIIWGTWFNTHRRWELTKNARVQVDIPNTLDDIWGINIMKQKAIIPKSILRRMSKIVDDVLITSETQQKHRGRKENPEDLDYIWDRVGGRDKTYYYQINRDSKVYKTIRDKMTETDSVYLDMLVSEIEKNIPIQQIYIDKSNEVILVEEKDNRLDEIYQLGITIVDMAKLEGENTIPQIIEGLMKSEPFCSHNNVREKLLKYYEDEII